MLGEARGDAQPPPHSGKRPRVTSAQVKAEEGEAWVGALAVGEYGDLPLGVRVGVLAQLTHLALDGPLVRACLDARLDECARVRKLMWDESKVCALPRVYVRVPWHVPGRVRARGASSCGMSLRCAPFLGRGVGSLDARLTVVARACKLLRDEVNVRARLSWELDQSMCPFKFGLRALV